MRMVLRSLALASVLSGGLLAAACAEETAARAFIDVAETSGGLDIVAGAEGAQAGVFSGELAIDRRGASGSAVTRQARSLNLQPGEKAEIARVSLTRQAGDRVEITVTLKRDGVVVSTATRSIGP